MVQFLAPGAAHLPAPARRAAPLTGAEDALEHVDDVLLAGGREVVAHRVAPHRREHRVVVLEHVMSRLRADGVEVAEQAVVLADAWTADEAFLTGTGAEVVPIASVDGRALDAPGPLTRRAQRLFAASPPSAVTAL